MGFKNHKEERKTADGRRESKQHFTDLIFLGLER